ncbi:MAG: flagellar hook-associated protein FlgK [Candidatus Glassbacteria bacterium]|nr:flagellar hook-associated protein FlgK [Candidatus Glassbacteria bacterium]
MATLTNAMNIGLSGLRANQAGLNVTGHNISNVNTEGYTRQQVKLDAAKPVKLHQGVFGMGVDISSILRYREESIDRQYRTQNQYLGNLNKQAESMDLIEGIINEPSETGLQNAIKNLFNSLQDLATNPESSSVRTTVREQGSALAKMFNQVRNQLVEIRENKNFEILDTVTEINESLDQIGTLNIEIAQTEALGQKANDMRDSRDNLLDKLSSLIDISAVEDPANSTTIVTITGQAFVVVGNVLHLKSESTNEEGREYIKILNPTDNREIEPASGELYGLFEIRDRIIPDLIDQLDELAAAMITEINAVHRQGYGLKGNRDLAPTNLDFFSGTDAQTMRLSYDLVNDSRNIAASSSGAPGDNSNALAMAQLRSAEILNDGTFTFEDFLSGIVSTFGLEALSIKEGLANQQRLVDHLDNYRESLYGVNMDEELVGMIRFQQAFGSCARVISTVNELMGVVTQLGRY